MWDENKSNIVRKTTNYVRRVMYEQGTDYEII